MTDGPRIRQLRDQIERYDVTIDELTAEREELRDALARELEEERLWAESKGREKLIGFGLKAILQIESGVSPSEVARVNSCTLVYLNEAIAAWRQYEGLVRKPKRGAD